MRREDRVLLRGQGEHVGDEGGPEKQRLPQAQPAGEQPQGQGDEERRHEDRALDQVGDGVGGHRIEGEDADRDPERGRIPVGDAVGPGRIVRGGCRLDRAQDLAVEPGQRGHRPDVERDVEEALLPPALAEEVHEPEEAAVRQHPDLEPERAVLVLQLVDEVGIVEHEGVAEAREVDRQHARHDGAEAQQVPAKLVLHHAEIRPTVSVAVEMRMPFPGGNAIGWPAAGPRPGEAREVP
jgi:hypothetical protein